MLLGQNSPGVPHRLAGGTLVKLTLDNMLVPAALSTLREKIGTVPYSSKIALKWVVAKKS